MDWNVSLWKIFILVTIQGLIGSNRFSCFENMRNFAVIGCPNKNLVKSAAPVSQILFISPVLKPCSRYQMMSLSTNLTSNL
jgi:hypothetical protein